MGAVHAWGHMGLCWWGTSRWHEGMGVGHVVTPEGLWGGWEVSMEGGTWGGRHIQWVGGTHWVGVGEFGRHRAPAIS